MQTINLKSRILIKDSLSVCFGFFDGFHLGHMALLNKTLEISKNNNTKSAVISFNQSPDVILNKTKSTSSIMSNEDKEEFLEKLGFDYFFIIDFNDYISKLDHTTFIKTELGKLNIKDIVVGFDNKYGASGKGNINTLKSDFQNDVNVIVIDKIESKDLKVGSTEIKKAITEGNIDLANKFLGRLYTINGIVVHGKGLGKTINFPTANLDLTHDYIIPKTGVYNVFVYYNDKKYLGILNVGNNPTFNYTNKLSIEVYIIDLDEDLYDKNLTIEFIEFVRDEKKFNSIEELVSELEQNKASIIKKHKI